VVFLGHRANAELVPKFHVKLHASHAAFPMATLTISPYTNVTLTSGRITLFVGDLGEGERKKVIVKQRNQNLVMAPSTKTNWPTDCQSQCNLKLN
jgi:hypothetical protein